MQPNKQISRRSFLKKTTGAAVGAISFPYIVSSSALGRDGNVAASNRITVGCVGVGRRGTEVMHNFLAQEDAHVVAVCDVKSHVRQAARNIVNEHYQSDGCSAYTDFRELVARDDIDAVVVASTDHWHVLHALAAVRAGKDVYCEKPLGMSVEQGQVLRREVNRYSRVFQFGTQQRSDRNFRFACELVRNGRIGKLRAINVWSPGSRAGGSPEPVPVPEWLDYNMWLGPAPYTPYTKDRCSNKYWSFISDYALGDIAGWGVHPLDIAIWGGGKELIYPVEIQGKGVWPDPKGVCDTATNWNVVLKYDSGVTINFAGNPVPKKWKKRYVRTSYQGTAFEGSEGWVHVDHSGINAHPKELLQTEFGPNEVHLHRSSNHVRNMLDCVKTRAETICPIDEAVQADTICQISDIAIRLEQKLRWDPENEKFINDTQADRMLKRPMRSPWRL
jgi:predicted dehydrogenase